MSDIIWNFIICLFIFWAGYRVGRIHAIIKIAREVANQMLGEAEDEVLLNIEKHEQHYFAYTSSHDFLAQGTEFIELFSNLKNRFPGRTFRVNRDQEHLTAVEIEQMTTAIFDVFNEPNHAKEQA